MSVNRVDVQADYATVRSAEVFGIGGVLQGEETEESMWRLLVEVERSKADGKEIFVSRAPLQGRDLETCSCFKGELPERQKASFGISELVRGILVEPVVCILVVEAKLRQATTKYNIMQSCKYE